MTREAEKTWSHGFNKTVLYFNEDYWVELFLAILIILMKIY